MQANPIVDDLSHRNMLKFAGAGLATTSLAASGAAWAQVAEEANTEPLNIVRKGIDKAFEIFNIVRHLSGMTAAAAPRPARVLVPGIIDE